MPGVTAVAEPNALSFSDSECFAPSPLAAKRGLLTKPIQWVAAKNQPEFADYSCLFQVSLCPQFFSAPRRAFPTMYCYDGPDIFEDHRAYSGEGVSWRIADYAADLITGGYVPPFNSVGVYPRPGERGNDLLFKQLTEPGTNRKVGGNGRNYARWFIEAFKPEMEKRIHALPGPENTVLVGASIAGLHCINLALEYPGKIGTVCALSPSHFMEQDRATANRLLATEFTGTRYFFGIGEREELSPHGRRDSAVTTMKLCAALKKKGWVEGEHFLLYKLPGGDHNNRSFGQMMLSRGFEFALGR